MNPEPRTKNQELRTENLEPKTKNLELRIIKNNVFLVLSSKFKVVNEGLTFIELLIVVSLIGVIGVITTQIFILGFRAQAKNEILKEVRHSGDYVTSVIEGMIKNAIDIPQAGCNVNTNELTIVNQDGLSTVFNCTSGAMASESAYPDPTPTVSVALTNNKVTVSGCTFRIVCPTPPLSPKYVFVNFTISQAGAGLEPETRASMEYQTTVSLRTYQ